jgi:hypothetical protein
VGRAGRLPRARLTITGICREPSARTRRVCMGRLCRRSKPSRPLRAARPPLFEADGPHDVAGGCLPWDFASGRQPRRTRFAPPGAALGANAAIDVTAAQLASTTFQSGSGSDIYGCCSAERCGVLALDLVAAVLGWPRPLNSRGGLCSFAVSRLHPRPTSQRLWFRQAERPYFGAPTCFRSLPALWERLQAGRPVPST